MKIDALVAEIGSTTTVMNAFDGLLTDEPRFLGQGRAGTSVEEGDVSVGLELALEDLKKNLGVSELSWGKMLASSSAAGGLRMTVHGLVYDMTVRAARETCLGSGGVIKYVTAGRLRRAELKKIEEIQPNIIFLAGGTDYGERDTALANAELLMERFPHIPLIYAGNICNQEEIRLMAEDFKTRVYMTDNVYPSLDQINTEPARQLIHKVFEQHIIHSPGMEKIRDLVTGPIIPTPGAVMESAILARRLVGDLIVIDIGGATTDLHSVSEGNKNNIDYLVQAEPTAKRTVEGDLGVFVNRRHLVEKFTEEEAARLIPQAEYYIQTMKKMPVDPGEVEFVEHLSKKACEIALERHAGKWIELFTASGVQRYIQGKDLTAVRAVVGTGGALTRLPRGREILHELINRPNKKLLMPPPDAAIYLDNDYIMASLGVLAKEWPEAALKLLAKSLGVDPSQAEEV